MISILLNNSILFETHISFQTSKQYLVHINKNKSPTLYISRISNSTRTLYTFQIRLTSRAMIYLYPTKKKKRKKTRKIV